jgi:hypothetical protein
MYGKGLGMAFRDKIFAASAAVCIMLPAVGQAYPKGPLGEAYYIEKGQEVLAGLQSVWDRCPAKSPAFLAAEESTRDVISGLAQKGVSAGEYFMDAAKALQQVTADGVAVFFLPFSKAKLGAAEFPADTLVHVVQNTSTQAYASGILQINSAVGTSDPIATSFQIVRAAQSVTRPIKNSLQGNGYMPASVQISKLPTADLVKIIPQIAPIPLCDPKMVTASAPAP